MKKLILILILIFAASTVLVAQQNNGVELFIKQSDADCSYGESIFFYDDNNDNRYDRIKKVFCDFSTKEYNIDATYNGYFNKNMNARLVRGQFSELDIWVEISTENQDEVFAILLFTPLSKKYMLVFTDKYKSESESLLKISPNPAKDFIEIEEAGIDNLNVKIFDESGKDVSNQITIISDYNQRVRIEITNLNPGAYLTKIGDKSGKFIKL